MKLTLIFSLLLSLNLAAQDRDSFPVSEISHVVRVLSSDSLEGRANGSQHSYEAAEFIGAKFESFKLEPLSGARSFLLPFVILQREGPVFVDDSIAFRAGEHLYNVVALLPGNSKKEEIIIFSAHYDHIGRDKAAIGDQIFNGANDNASGVAALLSLARYYSLRNDNERTLVFCAFAGEELGLLGSKLMASVVNPENIISVVNLEMLGRANAAGRKRFFLTGARHSSLEKIFKKNLTGSEVRIVKEPSLSARLFYRSDNFPFAARGIPAHTIMNSDDNDDCYHRTCDEWRRIDLDNLQLLIRHIPVAMRSLVSGEETPTRINTKSLEDL